MQCDGKMKNSAWNAWVPPSQACPRASVDLLLIPHFLENLIIRRCYGQLF